MTELSFAATPPIYDYYAGLKLPPKPPSDMIKVEEIRTLLIGKLNQHGNDAQAADIIATALLVLLEKNILSWDFLKDSLLKLSQIKQDPLSIRIEIPKHIYAMLLKE